MTDSIVLAKFLGIFLTVMGVGFVFNRHHIRLAINALTENHAIQFVATVIPLLLGSFIVGNHNIWVSNWTVLVTIVGWIAFVAGTVRAIFHAFWLRQVESEKDKVNVVLVGVILLILGLLLCYFGFNIAGSHVA